VSRNTSGPHVLVIVQNPPVPLDRRVWLECQALVAAGYRVSVVCPRGPGDAGYEELDGVRVHRYRPPGQAGGAVGYLWEFACCWLRTAWLTWRMWRRERYDALQACNPPDIYWALARPYTWRAVRFVYNQHDLNPEVFRSRFGEPTGPAARAQYRVLLWLERTTYRSAHHVIATNESYRRIALTRGGRAAGGVTVVRSGPDTSRMRPQDGRAELRRGRRHLAVYLGVMGPQDGVDVVVRAVDVLVHEMGRDDLHVALLGFGDCHDELAALAARLGVSDRVTFTGRADSRTVAEYLSTAHVGLSPDPKNPLNDVSTMNKTMEYLSYALPVVAFDLVESRVSAGDAAVYVEHCPPPLGARRYARAIAGLLDDPERRAAMGVAARHRAVEVLDWQPQRRRYVEVYDRLLGRPPQAAAGPDPGPVHGGQDRPDAPRRPADVNDPDTLREFVLTRRVPGADSGTGAC
jgi:glycosyltransferase involved in cell wall biosynthesis